MGKASRYCRFNMRSIRVNELMFQYEKLQKKRVQAFENDNKIVIYFRNREDKVEDIKVIDKHNS